MLCVTDVPVKKLISLFRFNSVGWTVTEHEQEHNTDSLFDPVDPVVEKMAFFRGFWQTNML